MIDIKSRPPSWNEIGPLQLFRSTSGLIRPRSHFLTSVRFNIYNSCAMCRMSGLLDKEVWNSAYGHFSYYCHIFSLVLLAGTFPREWKKAVPIFKKWNRHIFKNYWPICLTCTLCKVFERLLKEAMLNYLLTNNLLKRSQRGFLPRRSSWSAQTPCSTRPLCLQKQGRHTEQWLREP